MERRKMSPLVWVDKPEPKKVWNWRTKTMVWNYKTNKHKCPKCGYITETKTYNPDVYATPTLEELNAQGAAVVTELHCSKCGNKLDYGEKASVNTL